MDSNEMIGTLAELEEPRPNPSGAGPGAEGSDRGRSWIRRLFRSRNAVLGAAIVLVFILAALCATLLSPYSPTAPLHDDFSTRLTAPSAAHWMGTDQGDRDLATRLLYGARISLRVGLVSVALALALGAFLGVLAGYYGGWVDAVIMRAMDIMLAFPSILLAIAVVAILGQSLDNAMLAVGIVAVPVYARLARAQVLAVKEMDFVQSAHALGAGDARIIGVHILPNCLNPLIVQATLGVATAILDVAGLSFLGLGAKPPTPEWGTMLADTVKYMQSAPWTVLYPGAAIMLLVLGLNLFGDALRDALDPRLKHE